MKKIYLFLIIIIHFNVFSQKNLSSEGFFYSKNEKKYIIYRDTISNKDFSLEGHFYSKNEKEYDIYRDTISNKYFLKKDKGKIKLKNYKYIANLSNQLLQCLDDKNKMIFFDTRFKKLKKTRLSLSVCGTVNTYEYKIEKIMNNYVVTERILPFQLNNDTIKAKSIDSISVDKVDKTYFPNHQTTLTYDENKFIFNDIEYYPHTVIIEKDNLFGILNNGNITFYDNITAENFIIKLEKNHHFGYFKITEEIKYKTLEKFRFNLARFTLDNGKSGYIDEIGNEYYD